jgi:hypothetical protein
MLNHFYKNSMRQIISKKEDIFFPSNMSKILNFVHFIYKSVNKRSTPSEGGSVYFEPIQKKQEKKPAP